MTSSVNQLKKPICTLYSMAIKTFVSAIDSPCNIEDLTEITLLQYLPKTIRLDVSTELKRQWMKSTAAADLPDNVWQFEYRDLKDFKFLTKHDFLMLTHHPDDLYPDFWPSEKEKAHLYFDYYRFRLSNSKSHMLCKSCFIAVSEPTGVDEFFDHKLFWEGMNWKFYNIQQHFLVVPKDFVTLYLKDSLNWCDRCVFTPLFKLMNWEHCTEQTIVHETTDSDVETYDCVRLHDVL